MGPSHRPNTEHHSPRYRFLFKTKFQNSVVVPISQSWSEAAAAVAKIVVITPIVALFLVLFVFGLFISEDTKVQIYRNSIFKNRQSTITNEKSVFLVFFFWFVFCKFELCILFRIQMERNETKQTDKKSLFIFGLNSIQIQFFLKWDSYIQYNSIYARFVFSCEHVNS